MTRVPIVLCGNSTGFDGDQLIEGGQSDLYLSPIRRHLPEATIARQPSPGAVNAYTNHRTRYEPDRWAGEHASVQLSHGIADKAYRDAAACAMFTHVVAPGPALAESILRLGVPRWKLHVLGYPKLDPIYNGEVASPWPERDGRIRVLWAPTHGGGSEAHVNGNPEAAGARATTWWHRDQLLSLLDPDRFLVMEAPHPRHSPGRQATLAQYVGADVVIADGGSTMYEAWCVGLPVVFADWLTAERNLQRAGGRLLEARVYRERIGWHAHHPEDFPLLVEQAAKNGITREEHEFSLEVLPAYLRGRGGQMHADFLRDLASGPPHHLSAASPLPRRPEEITVRFYSMKYPNLAVPSIGVQFRPATTSDGRTVGVADVTTRGGIAHLQTAWMRRRGVLREDEATVVLAGETAGAAAPATATATETGAEGVNVHVPADGLAEVTVTGGQEAAEAAGTTSSAGGDRPAPPPTSGRGSGVDAWRAYAAQVTGSPVESYAHLNRDAIIDLLRSEGILPNAGSEG